ncbi:hypothetical protein FPANT_7144 [Fusarium pseudoanthophilum]|uniref:Uncharacterized protein n=1 Tax=Fusarium pseudoanthophilum TaxID=48495 RepID=A0A8H5P0Y1_9HYPO|nr:hypothetical protein FPANT_7144 [Fusarium pseudoanthophilum]
MDSSNSKRYPESRSSVGQVDDELNEIFQLDGVWETAWEEPIEDTNGMVLVDATQYAAFLKWQARNHEGESANPSLEPKGKWTDTSKKEDTEPARLEKQGTNIQLSQNHPKDRPSSRTGDPASDDKAQAWCEEFERKMDRMGIRHEFRHIIKLLEMSQLMDNDMKLFELVKLLEDVKKKDDEERQKSSHNGRN